MEDYREIMYPNTSMKLQDSDKTKIKDYLYAAGHYRMSHMVIMTSTKKSIFNLLIYTRFLYQIPTESKRTYTYFQNS